MYRNCADVAIITNTHQGSNTGGLVPTSLEDNPYAVKISKYNATSQIFQEETLVNRYVILLRYIDTFGSLFHIQNYVKGIKFVWLTDVTKTFLNMTTGACENALNIHPIAPTTSVLVCT